MLNLKNLLSTPTTQLGKAGRIAAFQIKLWSHCARLLKKNHSGRQAAALSYHTIFGIVPLAIVTLLVFQSFPAYRYLGDTIKNFIYKHTQLADLQIVNPDDPGQTVFLTSHIDKIVGNFYSGLNEGWIALFSAALVIWAALALLLTIERAFNNIWHVSKERNLLRRVINYWALLTLAPLLLGLGIYVSTRYTIIGQLQKTLFHYIGSYTLSYLVSTVIFFLLYFVLPNTKVKAKAAIWGAAIAALVWGTAKWAFGLYITKFLPYGNIYGALGLIPVTVLWIYISWLTVLFGLQLTFTTQHLKSLDAAELAAAKKSEEYFIANDFTIINITREIAAAFEQNKAPLEAEIISSKLNIPAEFADKILAHLVASGILIKSSEPTIGFMPAKNPANIKLSDIAEAAAAAGINQPQAEQSTTLQHVIQLQREQLAQHSLKEIIE